MRNSVLRKLPHVQLSLALLITLLVSLAFAGCGGGGGGGNGGNNNPPPVGNPNLADITGTVVTAAGPANPISGATITIVGTNPPVSAVSGSDGTFKMVNVPPSATEFTVTPPAPSANGSYFPIAQYNNLQYDLTQPTTCALPLPALQAGKNIALPDQIQIFPNNGSPPPIPSSSGCTGH